MASSYMAIPSDSDNEDDNMSIPAPTSDYDGGSDRSRSPERFHFFRLQDVPPSEEDPEEDPPERDNTPTIDFRSPRPMNPSGVRARTFATARKRVPTPIMQQWTRTRSPEPTVPTTDPYARPTGSSQGWERTLDTLRSWKNAGRFPPSTRGKGPIAARYEPILDTTPIIVDQMVIHENRLDLIEDGMMDMPGGDAFNELQEQVNNAEGNISDVNDTAQSLKVQVASNTKTLREMEAMMDHLDLQTGKCHSMMVMAQGLMENSVRMERLRKTGEE